MSLRGQRLAGGVHRRAVTPSAQRCFGFDVLTCPCCGGRMKLLALVMEPKRVARYLRAEADTVLGKSCAPSRCR